MDRKAPRHSRLSHSTTPYDRPQRRSTLPNGDVPQTPMRGGEEHHAQTPGSIFSKVISMFTPSRWNVQRQQRPTDDENEQQKAIPEKGTSEQHNKRAPAELEAHPDQAANTTPGYLPFLFSPAKSQPPFTPEKPREPFAFTPTQLPIAPPSEERTASPNEMLANFFREKGDAPLSSIEVQGVMALMQQAQQTQLEERRQTTPSLPSSFSAQTSPQKTVTEQLYPNVPSFVTPARHRSGTPGLRVPRYNPIFTPQPRRAITPMISKPKPAVQYPTISTPFKSRSTTPQPSSGKRLKTGSDMLVAQKPEPKQVQPSSSSVEHGKSTTPSTTPKRMSQTASALLSLIEPVGTPSEVAKARVEDREHLTDPAIKSFINPYAASTPLAAAPTRRKQVRKESLIGVGTSRKKRRALDEIERTIPANEKVSPFASGIASATPHKPSVYTTDQLPTPEISTSSAHPDGDSQLAVPTGSSFVSKQTFPAISLIEKFKPSKSSHLRKSFVMDAPESPVLDAKSPEKKSAQPKPSPLSDTSGFLLPLGKVSDDSTEAKDQEHRNTIFMSPPKPVGSQNIATPDEWNVPTKVNNAPSAGGIVTAVPATVVSTARTEPERKALSTNDYKAYVPRFFFPGPGLVEVSSGSDDVSQKARNAPEKAFQDYKFRFTFPDVSSSAST
ncbi:hypothetical protein V1525DRAFT_428165 [Lipomyces kononenkoae]|uniref:Uncharacterized protein n=1 Tax=Lipomyces kononenkoae TaxID=34357 RepID=A0ACC3STM2_LIPKO